MNQRAFALAVALLMLTFGFPSAVTGTDGPLERLTEHDLVSDEPSEYIVGFYDLPRDHDQYQGEPVTFVDQDLTYFVVETEDPYQFEIRVQTDDRVRYLEENHNDYQLAYEPNDPRLSDQYGVQQANAPSAWDTTLGSTAVTIGLLDTGITESHEDFDETNVDGWNYVGGNSDFSDAGGACAYHGSHTAGSAAALTDNGAGIAGMSNSAIIMQKIFDGGTFSCGAASTSDIAQALKDLGDQGAHISSNSWGGGGDQALVDAIDYANDKGVIHVAAAGNDGSCTDCVGEPWKSAQDQVIIVSASAEGDTWASFSSQGPEVSVIAPGDSILSVDGGTTSGYQSMSGTSMATPHVAGAVGVYIDANGHPGDHATMEQLVRDTADDIGLPSERQGDGQLNTGALVGDGTAGPSASFTSSCQELACTFDASGSSGSITAYDWDLGDGSTATGETTDHTYATDGTYTVTLTVTDDAGATDTASETVSVSSDPGGGALFFDGFEDGSTSPWTTSGANSLWRAANDCVTAWDGSWMLAFSLEGTCTYDDGHATGTATSPVIDASGQESLTLEFAHFFEVESWSGEYDVMQVQASADGGSSFDVIGQWDSRDATNTDWTVETFDISSYATSQLALRFSFDSQDGSYNNFPGWYIDNVDVTGEASDPDPNEPPTASFTSDCTDLSCTFDASGSSDADGTISAYDWDLGDGNTATGETTDHTYAADGTYTVTLTVTDDAGATDTATQDVTVEGPNEPPTASFTSDCTDLSCSFDASGSSDADGSIESYDWGFGDSNTGTGEVVDHTYAADGTYTVTLTVTDDAGATDTATQDVTVEEPAEETVYAEDFSDGTADGWTKSSNDNDLWRVADDCVSVPVPTHQLAFSQSSTCDYDVGHAVGWANSPTVDTSGYSTVTLEFTHFYEVESWSGEYDVMQVQVSQDGGSSWDVVAQWDSGDNTNDQHETVTFDVSSYASSQFEVRYHFDSQDGSYNNFQGWYIDDITILGE